MCRSCNGVFGMIGVVASQTLRLRVGAPSGMTCSASLGFVDQHGTPVGPAQKSVLLNSGQSALLDLNANTLSPALGSRLDVRPVVTPLPGPVASFCQSTAEVFDTVFGIDQVLIPAAPLNVPIGTPNWPLGFMGLTRSQVLRLSVANAMMPNGTPNGPCAVQLSFLDTNGQPIGPPGKNAILNPGEAASLDLAGDSVVGAFFMRMEVQPAVSADSIPGVAGVAACAGGATSAEAFDALTGRTETRLMPQGQNLP
jgi:hypothetical protein